MKNLEQLVRMKKLMLLNEDFQIDPTYDHYFHGGNLEEIDYNNVNSKTGRTVYGLGLYLTTSRTVAEKYARGSRKLYVVKVEKNIKDYNEVELEQGVVKEEFKRYLSKPKYNLLLRFLERQKDENVVNSSQLNNFLLNSNLISKNYLGEIANFFKLQGIDGEVSISPFGYGEKQLVLINLGKIIDIQRISPSDPDFYDDFDYKK